MIKNIFGLKIFASVPLLVVYLFFLPNAGLIASLNPIPGLSVIPRPEKINIRNEYSEIRQVSFSGNQDLTTYEKELIFQTAGVSILPGSVGNVTISLDNTLPEEAYSLEVGKKEIRLNGGSTKGVQYGITSLIQIIQYEGFPLPMFEIQDNPAFLYRGMHLDVGRHFFSVADIKKYLDYMAYYKYNHFHWHLTEDQGWRIEIKKYPKLQETGAFRNKTLVGHYNDIPHVFDNKRYGGYYTQSEIKEIVQYALDRHIQIIPEIEMPGHALAALASYPELGCTGGPYEVGTLWGVFDDVFCPTEKTFSFLADVLDEVMSLFPYKYIHIGGDECPKITWKNNAYCQNLMKVLGLKDEYELQSYFIKRMEKYILSKGKQIIGWDEILEGGLAPNATVMSWRGTEGGMQAARMKHDVIMTPGSHCYFDYYQSTSDLEPLAIGGYTPIEKVYHWRPIPENLDPEFHQYILGGQANVWTEYMKEFKQVEYMAYARGLAMSEALWTTPGDFQDFIERFLKHHKWWKSQGVNMANHVFELKPKIVAGKGKNVNVSFELPYQKQVWHEWAKQSEKGVSFDLKEKGNHHFTVDGNGEEARPLSIYFNPHKGTGAKIHMNPQPSPKYPGNGPGSVVNGILGSDEKYGGTEWLGFEGKDVQVLLEWKNNIDIQSISTRFFKGEGQWIYLPESLEIHASQDGRIFEKIKTVMNIATTTKVAEVRIQTSMKDIRFLRIDIQNYGIIPQGAQGAGHRAWLFMDEIVVE